MGNYVSNPWDTIKIMITLKKTCDAFPEQYDAYLGDEKIGYLRLRHGHFRAEYRGEIVYEADTIGDGFFQKDEMHSHLNAACEAILAEHEGRKPGACYRIEGD